MWIDHVGQSLHLSILYLLSLSAARPIFGSVRAKQEHQSTSKCIKAHQSIPKCSKTMFPSGSPYLTSPLHLMTVMPLPEKIYCPQQINIPPELPDILKNFTKAVIRTQPKDLLLWSASYFSALSKGECLPVKDRLEMNVAIQTTDTDLTPGLLKILHKQLSPGQTCSKDDLQKKWRGLCLPLEQLETLLSLGSFGSEIDWMEFFVLGCSAMAETLMNSMKLVCEILTDDEEGGAARIPFDTFVKLFTYMAHLDGDLTQSHIDVLSCLREKTERQGGMIKPRDFMYQDALDSTPPDSSDTPREAARTEE